MKRIFWLFVLAALALSGPAEARQKKAKVRIGHFPNITHAQTVIAHATHKVEDSLGDSAKVEWKVFNAGPSAIEAIFAGALDIAVIGPSPAINAFVKSNGEAVRVIAGSASGGAALVVRGDLDIRTPEDFRKKKIASPQLGNTQDVALRAWLAQSGLKLKEVGGDVQVLPISNADQQTLFLKKGLDAAWTVEPWVSLLIERTGAKVFLEESDLWARGQYSTALVLVRRQFLDEQPEIVQKFLEVHVDMTDWVEKNREEAKKIVGAEIAKQTGKDLPPDVLDSAFARLHFTTDPLASSIVEQAKAAYTAGYLKEQPDLGGLFYLRLLEDVLKARGVQADWLEEVPPNVIKVSE